MSNYRHVYFRINTSSYYNAKYGLGFDSEETTKQFKAEAANIFINDGWEVKKDKYNSSCPTVIKDKQELYLHPQSFSGVVKEDNILYIENLLKNSNIFTFRNTDIYYECFDIADEEYLNILESKRIEIANDILESHKTKRSNLYRIGYTCLDTVFKKYQIRRLSHHSASYSSNDIDWKYIEGVFNDLIKENKILTAQTKHGTGYRTAKEKELKATA